MGKRSTRQNSTKTQKFLNKSQFFFWYPTGIAEAPGNYKHSLSKPPFFIRVNPIMLYTHEKTCTYTLSWSRVCKTRLSTIRTEDSGVLRGFKEQTYTKLEIDLFYFKWE